MSSGTVSAIYGRRKFTSDLNDQKFAQEIDSFRQSGKDNSASERQVQQLQQRQFREIRLPQEKLQQRTPLPAEQAGHSRFSAFKSATRQQAPAPTSQQALQYPSENRFELYYSRSCPRSRQKAEQLLQGLESYFTDSYIKDHVVAIDFDDDRTVGPVHQTIVNSSRYLALIQKDCILYDKFKGYLLTSEHNMFKILKAYCQSFVPKEAEEEEEEQERAVEHHRLSTQFEPPEILQPQQQQRPSYRPMPDDNDAVPRPPRGLLGVSMLAKQVGADITSPTANVNLQVQVPQTSNALLLAETQEDLDRLPQANVANIYGKKASVTLGYGENQDAIRSTFVDKHNTSNTLEREISAPQQQTQSGSGKKAREANVNWQRHYGKEQLQKQRQQQLQQTPTSRSLQQQQSQQQQQQQVYMEQQQHPQQQQQPQHLQGLPAQALFLQDNNSTQQAAVTRSNSGGANIDQQMGTIRQIKVKN